MNRLQPVVSKCSSLGINIANGNDFPIETLVADEANIQEASHVHRGSPRHRIHTTRLSAVLDSVRGSVLTSDESRPQSSGTQFSGSPIVQQVAGPSSSTTSIAPGDDTALEKRQQAADVSEDSRHLRHCDRQLLAPLFVMSLLHAFDKNVSHAKTMGMDSQLGISSAQWSILLTACYLGFVISTILVVVYIRVDGKRLLAMLGSLTIMMGSVTALMPVAADLTHAWLWVAAIRFLQGLFEAGFNAMMATYLLQFYTAAQLAPRMFVFFLVPAGAACLGSLYAFGMFHIGGAAVQNWQAFFVAEGLFTVICSTAAWFWLPYSWENASWHRKAGSDMEKINQELGLDSPLHRTTTLQFIDEGFDLRQLRCLLRSVPGRSWMLADISLGVTTALVLLYLPQMIEKLGFSAVMANLLTAFPYIAALGVLFVSLKCAPGTDQARAFLVVCIFALQAVGFFIYFLVLLQAKDSVLDATSVTSPDLSGRTKDAGNELDKGLKALGYLSLCLAASGVGTSNVLAAKLYGLRIDDHALRLVVNTVGVALINLAGGIASWAPETNKQEVFGFAFATFGFFVTLWSFADDALKRRRARKDMSINDIDHR
jgi:MFS family permease